MTISPPPDYGHVTRGCGCFATSSSGGYTRTFITRSLEFKLGALAALPRARAAVTRVLKLPDQFNSNQGLWLLCHELERRLHAYFGSANRDGAEKFAVNYVDPLPLQEYFEVLRRDEKLR